MDNQPEQDIVPFGLTSKKAGIAGVAAALLVAVTGFIYGTPQDQNETATLTAAEDVSLIVSDIKTPISQTSSKSNPTERPAAAIQSAGGAKQSNTLRQAPDEQIDLIVRFQNHIPELDDCTDMFRTDKDAARKMFADWAETKPALSGVRLKSVSYSGEMILTWTSDIGRPLLRAELDDKVDAIKAMPSVRYADPDFTTRSEGGR